MSGGAFGEVAAQGPNTPFQFLMGLLALPALRERAAEQTAFGEALAAEMLGRPGAPAIPAAPQGRTAGQPAVEAQPGADFATAINRVLLRNPARFGQLASTAFSDDPVMLRRILLGDEPTPEIINLNRFEESYNAGERVPAEVAAAALGLVPDTPEKLRVAAGISSILGREPTESELQRFFGLVSEPGTVVNVAAPDMRALFGFAKEEQVAKRQDMLTKVNTAMQSINDLIDISALPNANELFGPIGQGARLLAPVAELMNFNKAFFVFGPDIRTLGQAKAKSATALADAARLVLAESGTDVSKREQELAGRVLADPDAFITSASQVNEAAKLFSRRLQTIATSITGELRAGGTTPQARTIDPTLDPTVEARITKRGAEILRNKGITEENATREQREQALDKAILEILGRLE
jgi:hypothetical protein